MGDASTRRAARRRPGPAGRLCCGGAVLFCLFLAAPGGTVCDARQPGPGEVRVSVVAILASEHDKRIDPRVECIAKEVRKVHHNLTGFRLAKMTCKTVPVQGAESFELVIDQHASVTVLKS